MLGMIGITGNKMAPFPGGVLIKNKDGQIIGAVGISGASADEDEYCALMAVQQNPSMKDCVTVPAQHSCTTLKK